MTDYTELFVMHTMLFAKKKISESQKKITYQIKVDNSEDKIVSINTKQISFVLRSSLETK